MLTESQGRPEDSPSDVEDRRHSARLPQDVLLKCNLGEICDISKTGMRIRRKGVPRNSLVSVNISDGNEQLQIQAEVVWVKKRGFRNYEMGLQFIDLSGSDLAVISRFAMYNRYNRTM